MGAVGISSRRPQHKFFTTLWNAPEPEIGGKVQAEKMSVAKEIFLWGCPVMYFKATLPFYGMWQDFAAFWKRPQQPLAHCFK
jgi:hypothetical protein